LAAGEHRQIHRAQGRWEKFRTHGQLEEFPRLLHRGRRARCRRHAIFDALETHFRIQNIGDWRIWPPAYRDAASPAVAEFAREHHDEVEYYLFLQFLTSQSTAAAQAAARQAGMHVGLIADLATGMDPSGSDAWSAPDNVLIGLEIGAAPRSDQ
jgi:4-alpha-glucanotransferase